MKRTSYRPVIVIIALAILTAFYSGCREDDRKVVLSLKFRPNQSLQFRSEIKKSTEIFEGKKLVYSNSGSSRLHTTEEVEKVLGPDSAKVCLIYNKAPDSPLSQAVSSSDDSIKIEYIQNSRGLILDFVRGDTGNLDMINYYEKLYEQMAPMYPEEPVSKGYTWNNSVKLMLHAGEITDASTTYKVRAFVREQGYDCAVVEYHGNTIVPFRNESNGSRIIRLDRRSAKGVFYLAYREGFIVKLEEIFDYTGEGTRYHDSEKTDFTIKENGTYSYHLVRAVGI